MKYSIRNQFTLIFGILMAGTVLLCWFINITFLEDYYLRDKARVLENMYQWVNQAALSGEMDAAKLRNLRETAFGSELQVFCSENNISFAFLTPQSIIITNSDPVIMERQLLESVFGRDARISRFLAVAERYQMGIKTDFVTQAEFVEMWGDLDNGYVFLFRIAFEGIRDSVALANRFLAYVGAAAVLLSGVIIFFVSKKTTDPIMELARISERMIDLDFEAKYMGQSQNEVALLGKNINALSDSLEKTISELKSANIELLRDIQRKNEIDAMRSEFISNVSHELKTPIALIQGYAEGLLDRVTDDQESRDFYCDVIVDEAAKMNEVVKKLLTLNELEFGQAPIAMERFDIVLMIANYLGSVDILIKQRGIMVDFNESEAIFVWADEFKVLEVINNYFTNALNHVPDQGVIKIDLTKSAAVVRISIWNEGERVPEENIPYLWDKFYKVDKARTRTYGGSGIGLSIVRAIMEAMNREYGVMNVDNGVLFWFELEWDGGKT